MTWARHIEAAEKAPTGFIWLPADLIIKLDTIINASRLVVQTKGEYDLDHLAEAIKEVTE